MAVTSGFYNSVSGDRKYNALQMSSIFDGIIEDGVYSTIGDHFSVTAGTGNTMIVGTGRAWFNHTWTLNDADYPVTLEPSEVVLNRYDAIVIEVNGSNAVRGNSIKVIKGTPGSSPSKPSLAKGDNNIWQHPLAYVYVPAGSSSISQSNIEYVVGKSECPFVVAAVQSVNIDALVAQWQDEFDTWFDNLEYQLSGDVAGNLQNQINQKADKANIIDDPDDLLANQATGMIAGAKAVSELIGDIKAARTFSSSEIETDETWVDGKKIYRRTFVTTDTILSGSALIIPLSLTGIVDNIWIDSQNSYVKTVAGDQSYPLPLPKSSTSADYYLGVWCNTAGIRLFSNGGWNQLWEKCVTIKYTKM